MAQEIINEVYSAGTQLKNLGRKSQRAISTIKTLFMAHQDFAFSTLALAKGGVDALAGIASKNLVPFPNTRTIELVNVENTVITSPWEGEETIREGLSGVRYRVDISENGFLALKSIWDAGFTKCFQISQDNEHTCEIQDDGTVKGRPLASFRVDKFVPATLEDKAHTFVNLMFKEEVSDTILANYDASEFNGIDDLDIEVVSASATSIKFKAKTKGIASSEIKNLATADVNVKDLTKSVHTSTFVDYDAETGVYELTGTGFADGFTVGLVDVVTKGIYHFETPVRATLTGIA